MALRRIPMRVDGGRVVHAAVASVGEWQGMATYTYMTGRTVCGRRITASWSVQVEPATVTCGRCS